MPTEHSNGSGDGARVQSGTGDTALKRITNHISSNKIEASLWMTRMCTIFCTINFFIPLLTSNPYNYFHKCLLSNCITSALRLHQRVPNFRLTREFLSALFAEDSAHYFVFSLIFLSAGPMSMPLIPLFLYALLHVQNYTKQILNLIGPTSLSIIRSLLHSIETNQVNILRFIACVEISLMPMIIVTIFTGQSYVLLPYLYYRFLCLRYSSNRNPYCKQFFHELRMVTEHLVNNPQCPGILRIITFKAIGLVCRIAPST